MRVQCCYDVVTSACWAYATACWQQVDQDAKEHVDEDACIDLFMHEEYV